MFERLVPVRWRDTDAQGHVNHAVFLTYLEEARDAFFEHVIGADPSYVVARVEVDLCAEVRRRPIAFSEAERVRLAAAMTPSPSPSP
ncbi:MAG: acyl-CoA thioesterase [Streptosporangiaceae bacterium]